MKNLRELILQKMEEKNYTNRDMSIICDVSMRRFVDIKNGKVTNIDLSTLVKICEGAGISYIDVFEFKDMEVFDRAIRGFVLTDGKEKYKLHRVSTTPPAKITLKMRAPYRFVSQKYFSACGSLTFI